MDKDIVELESKDIVQDNIEKLKELFPHVVTDGKIDFDTLQTILGQEIEKDNESYKFEWVGKQNCYKTIQTPSNGTLKYIEEDSLNPEIGENIVIEGDNLEVLKLLQSSYKNSIKMIYIDPPYNTGNDFVYSDNYETPLENYFELTGQKVNGEDTQSKKSKEGRKHTQWLNMIFPRLLLSRTLLKDDGVIFISIDDNEIDNLKKLCDEVFGEENFISKVSVINNIAGRSDKKHIATGHEYLLMYQKSDSFKSTGLPLSEEQLKEYKYTDEKGFKYRIQGLRKRGSGSRREDRPNMYYPIYFDEETNSISLNESDFKEPILITPKLSNGSDGRWRWGRNTFLEKIDLLEVRKVDRRDEYDIYEKVYLDGEDGEKFTKMKSYLLDSDFTSDTATSEFNELMGGLKVFDSPKPIQLIKNLITILNDKNSVVLDFFGGSGTTGQSILEMNQLDNGNRKFIMVQLPENIDKTKKEQKVSYEFLKEMGKPTVISEITKERMRRVINGYGDNPQPINDGFKVFKLDNSNYKINETINVSKDTDKDEIISKLRKQFRQSTDFEERFVEGYTQTDIIYENIIKEGYNLNSKIELVEDINPYKVYKITDSIKKDKKFYITFDKVDIDIKLKNEFMGISNDTLFICVDHLLSDSDKDNLKDTFQLKTL